MQFENQFQVAAPLDEVWQAVLDVERVAPTVPGAKVLEKTGDTAYKVAIKVKVGPMSMTYKGDVEIVEQDDAAHRAVMRARAKESRGQGTADADVTMTLSGDDGTTSATITTDVDLSGKVATMGQGVLQDVSGRLVQTFAKNLAAMLEGGGAPEAQAAETPPAPDVPKAPNATRTTKAKATPSPADAAESVRRAAEAPRAETPPKQAPPEADDALDLGELGGAVVAERLRDPQVLGVVIGLVALVAYLLGRRAGR